MSTEPLDPAQMRRALEIPEPVLVMKLHAGDTFDEWCSKCRTSWPCLPYLLAEALAAERAAHKAEVSALVDEGIRQKRRANAERARVQRVETLFAGGPDTSCRTVWRTFAPWGCSDVTECVEVPMDDLRAALAGDTEGKS